ncbi:MAG: PilZ domain-containing protein [Pseudomonadota bacterium]
MTEAFHLGALTVTPCDEGVDIDFDTAFGGTMRVSARDAAQLARYLMRARTGESRMGFRVPLRMLDARTLELRASLVYQGTIYDLQIVDISLTGVLVLAHSLTLDPGANVVVRVICGDLLSKAEASVVRCEDGLMALHFTDSMRGGELTPPAHLETIVKRLEQLYLQSR